MSKVVIEWMRTNGETTTFQFDTGTYIIGREKGDIVAEDPQVSGRHAQLDVNNGGVTYTDLGSTNGSFLEDGTRLQAAHTMTMGTLIRVGRCQLKFAQVEQPDAFGKTILQSRISSPPPPPPTVAMPGAFPPAPAALAQPSEAISAPLPAIQLPPPKVESASEAMVPALVTPSGPALPVPVSASAPAPSPAPRLPEKAGQAGWFAEYITLLKWGFESIRPNIVKLAWPIALLTIPVQLLVTVFSQLALFVPAIGPVIAILISIVGILLTLPLSIALALLVYPLLGRVCLAHYLGEEMSYKQAWQQHKRNLGGHVLSTFVSSLIAGLTLGILGFFIFQVPYVEGKRNLDVNLRSFEIFKVEWKKVLLATLGTGFLIMIPMWIAAAILGFIPFLGPIVATCIMSAVGAVMGPFIMLLLTRLYFEIREKTEGRDPRPDARNALHQG